MTEDTRVLLVEDNPGDARLLRAVIPTGFSLDHVERLQEAVAAVAAKPYDVVLLDLSLPDSHGLETCRRARQACPELPVIVLTGLSDEQVAIQAMREGAQDWLVKGRTDGEMVVRAIRYAIERNRLHTRLRELDRVRSMFLSVVSHDLRSPAASILAGIDLLLGERMGPLGAEQRHVLELARKSALKQTRLIRDLLDAAVIEAGAMQLHPAEHPLRPLVDGVLGELALTSGGRLVLVNDVPEELAFRGDADRVAQALGNLGSNAVKYASGLVRVSAGRAAEMVDVAVEDDGPGVDPEVRDHLFDRFVRSDGPRGGAGLGLWIVNGIAEAHHGKVRVESRAEGGSRFVLSLPSA